MKTQTPPKNDSNICLVSCSVLKKEIQQLINQEKLNTELVLVSKNFHIEYSVLEENLRKVLEHTKKRFKDKKIVLVYGDLCLGQSGEMKKLADEYQIVKVDALNCVDCQMGGKGQFLAADPNHNLMFMGPGMIDFFKDARANMLREGVEEEAFSSLFSGIKGFVILDTCGNGEELKAELEKIGMGVPVLEIRKIGSSGVLSVILDAINHT